MHEQELMPQASMCYGKPCTAETRKWLVSVIPAGSRSVDCGESAEPFQLTCAHQTAIGQLLAGHETVKRLTCALGIQTQNKQIGHLWKSISAAIRYGHQHTLSA